jgi:hypothetical protein
MEDNLQEARRYLNNAKEILREKARKEGDHYQDKKYVRLAGHAAYSGVLIALDGLLGKKECRVVPRKLAQSGSKGIRHLQFHLRNSAFVYGL